MEGRLSGCCIGPAVVGVLTFYKQSQRLVSQTKRVQVLCFESNGIQHMQTVIICSEGLTGDGRCHRERHEGHEGLSCKEHLELGGWFAAVTAIWREWMSVRLLSYTCAVKEGRSSSVDQQSLLVNEAGTRSYCRSRRGSVGGDAVFSQRLSRALYLYIHRARHLESKHKGMKAEDARVKH